MTGNSFQNFVMRAAGEGRLVVQPRMGVSDPGQMRAGLEAVRNCAATAAGTITVDSYTRVNDHDSARKAIADGTPLNGFPIVAHGVERTTEMLAGIEGPDFPVQVRHGSAKPYELFQALVDTGIEATEGGPVSYCLPYSRVPLREATDEWVRCIELAANAPKPVHVETFGGCMLGQLCPPGLLVAMSVLESMFFVENGLRTLSLSYAQQTNLQQDVAAVRALRRLAEQVLPGIDWHIVIYTYMGVYPNTELGAFSLLEDSVRLAVSGGAERLIVKTPAEAHRIPTVGENVSALEFAAAVDAFVEPEVALRVDEEADAIFREASTLIESTLDLSGRVGDAMVAAFADGRLDVPYCLHRDNANKSRADVDTSGRLVWTNAGRMPVVAGGEATRVGSARLLDMLGYNRDHHDQSALSGTYRRSLQP